MSFWHVCVLIWVGIFPLYLWHWFFAFYFFQYRHNLWHGKHLLLCCPFNNIFLFKWKFPFSICSIQYVPYVFGFYIFNIFWFLLWVFSACSRMPWHYRHDDFYFYQWPFNAMFLLLQTWSRIFFLLFHWNCWWFLCSQCCIWYTEILILNISVVFSSCSLFLPCSWLFDQLCLYLPIYHYLLSLQLLLNFFDFIFSGDSPCYEYTFEFFTQHSTYFSIFE